MKILIIMIKAGARQCDSLPTCQGSYAYWCSNGIPVMGITNLFLIGIEALYTVAA